MGAIFLSIDNFVLAYRCWDQQEFLQIFFLQLLFLLKTKYTLGVIALEEEIGCSLHSSHKLLQCFKLSLSTIFSSFGCIVSSINRCYFQEGFPATPAHCFHIKFPIEKSRRILALTFIKLYLVRLNSAQFQMG